MHSLECNDQPELTRDYDRPLCGTFPNGDFAWVFTSSSRPSASPCRFSWPFPSGAGSKQKSRFTWISRKPGPRAWLFSLRRELFQGQCYRSSVGLLWPKSGGENSRGRSGGLVLIGWYRLQYPIIVNAPTTPLTIYTAAAPEPTLRYLLYALIAGSVIIFPALFYLLKIFKLSEADELAK